MDHAAARHAFEEALRTSTPNFETFFLSRFYGLSYAYEGETLTIIKQNSLVINQLQDSAEITLGFQLVNPLHQFSAQIAVKHAVACGGDQ